MVSMQVSAKRGVSARLIVTLSLLTAMIIAAIIAGVYFAPVTAPNVVGMSVPEAAAKLANAGIRIEVAAKAGVVTDQSPIAGERWTRGDDFVLTYTNDTGTHVIGGNDFDG